MANDVETQGAWLSRADLDDVRAKTDAPIVETVSSAG